MQDSFEILLYLGHITLSAGGYSISYHLTSHQSKDYFQAAIVQSGPLEKSGYEPPPERQRLEHFFFKVFFYAHREITSTEYFF